MTTVEEQLVAERDAHTVTVGLLNRMTEERDVLAHAYDDAGRIVRAVMRRRALVSGSWLVVGIAAGVAIAPTVYSTLEELL